MELQRADSIHPRATTERHAAGTQAQETPSRRKSIARAPDTSDRYRDSFRPTPPDSVATVNYSCSLNRRQWFGNRCVRNIEVGRGGVPNSRDETAIVTGGTTAADCRQSDQ